MSTENVQPESLAEETSPLSTSDGLESASHSANAAEPDYKVGYRKPPVHTRFKPGVSGNPRGRPKRPRPHVSKEIQDIFIETVPVRRGSRTEHVPKITLLVEKLLNDGIRGNARAAMAAYKLAVENGILGIEPPKLQLEWSKLTPEVLEHWQKVKEALKLPGYWKPVPINPELATPGSKRTH